ncbi:beta-N-acetylhexosaminidase [Draconibacterium sp.]
MKYFSLFLTLLAISCGQQKQPETNISVIPEPNQITVETGSLQLGGEINLSCNPETLLPLAEGFGTDISELLTIKPGEVGNSKIAFEIKDGFKSGESYALQTSKNGIVIQAGSEKGIFYGLQTLKQMILFSKPENEKIILPILKIDDNPRFGWRGIMLDESRHFFGTEKVKQLLDVMAMHKLNVFHWHLTDDPGWRIEIKKYPKLATVGGLGDDLNPDSPAQYYTQDEIREIVKYAADRYIEVIPEIDMPGHARAANRAYPEFSGGGSKSHPEFTFNPGKPETYAYLTDILKEIAALFPSNYIHLGGDEVHFGNEQWNTDAHVKQLMKTEKLQDLKAVESYFVNRMADSIKMLGKTVIGWDEIVDHHLAPENSLVMWWRHDKTDKLQAALSGNYNVILCPRIPLYFDFDQDESHEWGRKWGGAFSSLDLVYAFPPDTLPGFTEHKNYVKGMQANIWTERIHDAKRLDYMTYPRLSALAEAGWTNEENKDFDDFKRRLKLMLTWMDGMNISYYNPFQPELTPEPLSGYKAK